MDRDDIFLQQVLLLVKVPLVISVIATFTDADFEHALRWAMLKNSSDWQRLHHQPPTYQVPPQPEFIKHILAGGKYPLDPTQNPD